MTDVNVLLLRGLAREARHWGGFVDELQLRDGIGTLLCLDLPGVATKLDRTTPVKVGPIVDEIRGRWLKAKEGIDGDRAVLGISFGGMIGLDWCCCYQRDF